MVDRADELKQRIIDEARVHSDAGAHYLWSTAGNTPGNKDGAWYRPQKAELHPNLPDLESPGQNRNAAASKYSVHAPMLFTAFANTSDFGLLACTGRAVAINTPLALADMNSNISRALDLKWKDLTDDQVQELQRNSSDTSSFRWPRPNSGLNNNSTHHSTVWGESCVDTRHFDCIGFVNWCLTQALGQNIQYGIGNFVAKSVGQSIPPANAAVGDIVTIGAEHIGFVSENNTVIEAMDATHGVVESTYSAARWTQCFRLPAEMFR
jgi:cell wall-associated NlpC family hydrolase